MNDVKRRSGRFHLVVFDLDGTLIDSLEDLAISVNFALESLGAETVSSEQVRQFIGNGASELVRRSLEAAGIRNRHAEALSRFRAHYQEQCRQNTRFYPGITELLQRLTPVATLAVLTNKPAASTEQILDHLQGRDFFTLIVGGDTYPSLKPDPSGLSSIMQQLSVPPDRTLMVGDSEVDMETGRRAGTATCCAGWGMKSREVTTAGRTVFHPKELESLVRN